MQKVVINIHMYIYTILNNFLHKAKYAMGLFSIQNCS